MPIIGIPKPSLSIFFKGISVIVLAFQRSWWTLAKSAGSHEWFRPSSSSSLPKDLILLIYAGFQLLHIDLVLTCIFSLLPMISFQGYMNFTTFAGLVQHLNKSIAFEIGTEEQSGSIYNSLDELEYVISSVNSFVKVIILIPLLLLLLNRNSCLKTRNGGSFDSPVRVKHELPAEIQVPKIVRICENNNVLLKEHNADYLQTLLRWHPF